MYQLTIFKDQEVNFVELKTVLDGEVQTPSKEEMSTINFVSGAEVHSIIATSDLTVTSANQSWFKMVNH